MEQIKKTIIETLVEKANNDPTGAGYHIHAIFPDDSEINAPVRAVGPNVATFCELGPNGVEEIMVNVGDAMIMVDWLPGPAMAKGKKFDGLFEEEITNKRTNHKLLGFQITDLEGINIHGTEDDPFELNSFDVLKDDAVLTAKGWATDRDFLVKEVWEGDIENPSFVDKIEIQTNGLKP